MKTTLLASLLIVVGCAGNVSPMDEPDEPGTLGNGKEDGSGCATQFNGATVRVCNFHQVTPGIYRGARPSADGLRDLAALGIRTDIDLERTEAYVAPEAGWAADAGVDLVREPMSYLFAPTDAEVDAILAVMNDPARQPVYVHCKLGNDRTGLVVALDRVYNQGWAPADAWNEMMQLGFHRIWIGLSHYFEERTGYED